ncbi:hypothetical protein [Caldimonas aquatica]|uniref:Uncharacterized protein n=1 Tax=Caldimonas aquatica TaxID=376175 RepID=A0ABY6MWC7_9BURK|nr:hypothetical protein [Schlegelella aquatica]UZD56286.1 hypothetical protein OMP39_06890 [Schlegelella aquatica]
MLGLRDHDLDRLRRMHPNPPARYLVLIESGGAMVARLFDVQRRLLAEFDAGSEEVGMMTEGLQPVREAHRPEWDAALAGHSSSEREAALIYALEP